MTFLQPYENKTAFVLNANAKRVHDGLLSEMVDLVPAGDLFYSRTLKEAFQHYRVILNRGYGRLFTGGGDGTIMNAISVLKRIAQKEGLKLPHMGILKLGTGNALASVLGAKQVREDVKKAVQGSNLQYSSLDLLKCSEGQLAPFAGVGADAALLNDFFNFHRRFKNTYFDRHAKSLLGYICAGLGTTLPRYLTNAQYKVKVTAQGPAYYMEYAQGQDREISLHSEVLYEGPVTLVSVGTIPYFGYGLTMFPFSKRKEGFMQVRVANPSVFNALCHLYPGIWKGTYRHKEVRDFLVKQVTIESEVPLPYQVAGDPMGYRTCVSFGLQQKAMKTVTLEA